MKKLLLLTSIFIFASQVFAQDVTFATNDTENPLKESYIYCQIVGTSKFMSNKLVVTIDFGQEAKFFSDQRLRGEDGKPIVFNSMVDAMNWMGNDGWEFLQAYVVTMSQQNVYHWLLKLNLNKLSAQERNAILSKLKTKKDFKATESQSQAPASEE